MSDDAAKRYQLKVALELREFDGESVAYCDLTGDTIRLAPLSRAVIDHLSQQSADMNELCGALASRFGTALDAGFSELVEGAVEDLRVFGIIKANPI